MLNQKEFDIPAFTTTTSGIHITVTPDADIPALWNVHMSRSRLTIIVRRSVTAFTQSPDRHRWSQRSATIGADPACGGLSLATHLLLVLIGQQQRLDAATVVIAAQIAASLMQADSNTAVPQVAVLRDRDISERVSAYIDQGTLDVEGRWNTARCLVQIGQRLWHLRGDKAARHGTIPLTSVPGATDGTHLKSMAAALVTPLAARDLPLPLAQPVDDPVAAALQRIDAWIDWISLAAGPDPIPPSLLPEGLSSSHIDEVPRNGDNALDMPADRAVLLNDLADALLAEPDLPAPRAMYQSLLVPAPRLLTPLLSPWHIANLLIVPAPTGLWVATLNSTDQPLAAAWWPAERGMSRVPLSFAPSCWMTLHPILAALWHDLCAAAVVVDADPIEPAPEPRVNPRKKTQSRRQIVLPSPRTRRRAAWSSDAEQQAIETYAHVDPRYRPLPTGWQDRADRIDFQRRRQAAAARAESEGWPVPPPGYTFVRGHYRPGTSEPRDERPRIVSRGLMSVALGLLGTVERAAD